MNWIKELYKYRKIKENNLSILYSIFSLFLYILVLDLCAIIVLQSFTLNFLAGLGLVLAIIICLILGFLLNKTFKEINSIDELYLKIAGGKDNNGD